MPKATWCQSYCITENWLSQWLANIFQVPSDHKTELNLISKAKQGERDFKPRERVEMLGWKPKTFSG